MRVIARARAGSGKSGKLSEFLPRATLRILRARCASRGEEWCVYSLPRSKVSIILKVGSEHRFGPSYEQIACFYCYFPFSCISAFPQNHDRK